MNTNIESLYRIAQKPTRTIIGLMSGTSLDGLDVVLCEISGASKNTVVHLKEFKTIPYSEAIKAEIRKVFAKKTIDFQHLALLNEWIGILHANLVLDCLKEWKVAPAELDLIASHGQTVMHAPKILHQQAQFPNATLQIGDGDHIAVRTGIITISDFRQKHVAAGGEGVEPDHRRTPTAGRGAVPQVCRSSGGCASWLSLGRVPSGLQRRFWERSTSYGRSRAG